MEDTNGYQVVARVLPPHLADLLDHTKGLSAQEMLQAIASVFVPTQARPGSKLKVAVMAERQIRGRPLWMDGDRTSFDMEKDGHRCAS